MEDGKVPHQWATSSFITSFTLVKNSLVEVEENPALRFYKNCVSFHCPMTLTPVFTHQWLVEQSCVK